VENKSQIVEQCRYAFDFIQKLFLEVSYLVKEVEGLLLEEDFVIGRPSGYQISARGSSGLEPVHVNMWLLRKFGVFFAPSSKIATDKGQTRLSIEKPAKVIYLRVILRDEKMAEPMIYAGVLHGIQKAADTKWPTKFEQAMQHIEYNDEKIFKGDLRNIEYHDARITLRGDLLGMPLFDINDSEAISEKLVKPCLESYEQHLETISEPFEPMKPTIPQ
jgi:hypothetical protein